MSYEINEKEKRAGKESGGCQTAVVFKIGALTCVMIEHEVHLDASFIDIVSNHQQLLCLKAQRVRSGHGNVFAANTTLML